jgi:hypothetical protein
VDSSSGYAELEHVIDGAAGAFVAAVDAYEISGMVTVKVCLFPIRAYRYTVALFPLLNAKCTEVPHG